MSTEETQIPCIIDKGIIFNKRDMVRILQSLDRVEYKEIIDGKELAEIREGFILEIFEDPIEASIIFNRRLHLNVNSFEFFKITYDFEADKFNESNKQEIPEDSDNSENNNKYEKKENFKPVYRIELSMSSNRKIILLPLTDPMENPRVLVTELEERRKNYTWVNISEDEDFEN